MVSLDNNNKISTDLLVKSTDTHQYLLLTSGHPSHIKKCIPFSLALGIRLICSTTERFQQRTNELLEFLCKRGHRQQYVQSQINKAFQIPRRDTLFYKSKTRNTDRPVFVTTYNPSLPNLNNLIKKYYPILTATERYQEAFKDTPFLAYRRPKKLRDFLVKAKLKQSPPNNLHAAMMAAAVPVSSLLIAHHLILSTTLVNKEKSYKIYPALPTIWST